MCARAVLGLGRWLTLCIVCLCLLPLFWQKLWPRHIHTLWARSARYCCEVIVVAITGNWLYRNIYAHSRPDVGSIRLHGAAIAVAQSLLSPKAIFLTGEIQASTTPLLVNYSPFEKRLRWLKGLRGFLKQNIGNFSENYHKISDKK